MARTTHHAPCTMHHAPRTTHHAARTTHHAASRFITRITRMADTSAPGSPPPPGYQGCIHFVTLILCDGWSCSYQAKDPSSSRRMTLAAGRAPASAASAASPTQAWPTTAASPTQAWPTTTQPRSHAATQPRSHAAGGLSPCRVIIHIFVLDCQKLISLS